MSSKERKQKIVDLISEHNGCSVADLAKQLEVSKVTIRRDLRELDERGLVHRSHGGALPVTSVAKEPPFDEKRIRNLDEKKAIASRAVELLRDDLVVLFDGGTTTLQVVKAAPPERSIFPITVSPLLASELQQKYDDVKLSGGTLQSNRMTFVGPAAEEFLDRLNFNLLFLSTNGVSVESGLTTPNEEVARLKELMIRNSKHVVLVSDRTKFGEERFARFGELSDVDRVVTDGAIPSPIRRAFEKSGTEIVDDI
jgi:DeoR family transcriptional regulator, fructose operon transcriptional repressor